jgi:hypothetical protein
VEELVAQWTPSELVITWLESATATKIWDLGGPPQVTDCHAMSVVSMRGVQTKPSGLVRKLYPGATATNRGLGVGDEDGDGYGAEVGTGEAPGVADGMWIAEKIETSVKLTMTRTRTTKTTIQRRAQNNWRDVSWQHVPHKGERASSLETSIDAMPP